MAARAGQADVVRYLLKNGAKVETKSKVRSSLQSLYLEGGGMLNIVQPKNHLFCRMTRQRCIYPVAWGKLTLSSSSCGVAPLPMLPPPQATPLFIWLRVKDTKMLLSCCWRTEPPFPLQRRWVWLKMLLIFYYEIAQNIETHI